LLFATGKCKNQTAAVNISDISFLDISGTFVDDYAGQLLCSDSSPCRNVLLQDIDLKPANSRPLSEAARPEQTQPEEGDGGSSVRHATFRDQKGWDCWQVQGSSSNVSPLACI
jgi:hypothetical protein